LLLLCGEAMWSICREETQRKKRPAKILYRVFWRKMRRVFSRIFDQRSTLR